MWYVLQAATEMTEKMVSQNALRATAFDSGVQGNFHMIPTTLIR